MFEANVEKGLVFRLLEPRHAQILFDFIDRNRDHLSRWFPWVEQTRTVDDSKSFIRESLEQFARDGGFQLGIWLDGELTGVIGLQNIARPFRITELYYWLGAQYEGRGVMTKACRYLCGYLLDELNLNRIEIRCAEMNVKSRAIPDAWVFRKRASCGRWNTPKMAW